MARPGIMLYFDILEPIRVLPDSDKGRLLVAMLEYGQDGIVPEFDGMLALAWGFVKPKIDRDAEAYESAKVQREFASFCKQRKVLKLPKIPFEEWQSMGEDERRRAVNIDSDPDRAGTPGGSRYPTTIATPAATGTTSPSTSTKTTVSATAAAAANGSPDEFTAATAADRKLKMLQGELGKGVVALTDNQIDVLLDKMGLEMFDHYVAKLSDFIIRTGAQVKSHYATILKWWMEDSQDGGGQYESL